MPKFEIDNKQNNINEVLIDVPFGKRYLSDPKKSVPQNRQKGNTCWYYVFNFLRPRYGDNFQVKDSEARKIEKIFSVYRVRLTELTDMERLNKSILNLFNTTSKIIIEGEIRG